MKTKVFTYKGFVGISSDENAEGFLAKPEKGNLGCVLDASFVEIQPEALEELKKVKKSHDAIGDVDVFKANDGIVVFAWLGGYKKAFKAGEVEGSRNYDVSLLKATDGVTPEIEFIEFIDDLND